MGFSINDSVYSSVFFFLTGLHFFHVVVGIILISILFWSCSYNYIFLIPGTTTPGIKCWYKYKSNLKVVLIIIGGIIFVLILVNSIYYYY